MLNPTNIISQINKRCQIFFPESTFCLENKKYNTFTISGSYLTKAVNRHKNDSQEVNVLKWFDDFWIYIALNFEKSDTGNLNTFISLSVFQGDDKDTIKIQLFRAEWDNYENNMIHPQPHWHMSLDLDQYSSFKEYLAVKTNKDTFINSSNNNDSTDIRKFHFAMNGTWSKKGTHIHKINDDDSIINWFQGLLDHIKSQLENSKSQHH